MRWFSWWLMAGCAVGSAWGQETPAAKDAKPGVPPVVELEVSAAAEPSPPLRHTLLPAHLKLTPGNAAPFYYRATLLYRSLPEERVKDYNARVGDWLETPAAGLPQADVRKALDAFSGVLREVRTATHRESCDWGFRVRELRGPETVGFLLPEVQEFRNVARVVALRARLEIAAKRFDDALETLQMGYRMSQDVAREPLLINGLVGIACAQIMNSQLTELIRQEGSPNLYWAVTSLPRPLVDVRSGMRHEMWIGYTLFPVLLDARTARRSPEEWQRLLDEAADSLIDVSDVDEATPEEKLAREAARLARQAALKLKLKGAPPEARKRLVARGRDPQAVAAMADAQAILIDVADTYDQIRDEFFKWSYLPYPQGAPRMSAAEARLVKDGWMGPGSKELIPIAGTLLPALGGVVFAETRLDRSFAELRAIEAIRLHAAATGSLPTSLDEIQGAVVPDDPITGRPFPYRVEDGAAILESVVPPGKGGQYARTYRMRLRAR